MGDIITFYSYKGGVGRTFLMANIAALLSLWGYKTLCVDWDLEAPGLHHYFKKWLPTGKYKGLLQLIESFRAKKKVDWRDYTATLNLPGSKSPLTIMFAGKTDESFTEKIQNIDWDELYDHGFGDYLEKLRQQWKEGYDFIFIDSRTGITDIGGICTIQLPDTIAFVFAANNQSLDGAVDVIKRAMKNRQKLPYDRAGLIGVPIISRFDSREEKKLSEEWFGIIEKKVSPIVSTWKNKSIKTIDLLYKLMLPYFSYWSFGEKLPVIEEKRDDSESINYSLKSLASLIARGISKSEDLVSARDLYVKTVSSEIKSQVIIDDIHKVGRMYRASHDVDRKKVFLIYGHDKSAPGTTGILKNFLVKHGLEVVTLSGVDFNKEIAKGLIDKMNSSAAIIAICTPDDKKGDGTFQPGQNVLLEIGMAMGLSKGVQKLTILQRWGVKEENQALLPPDLGGILTIKFEDSIEHKFDKIKKRLIDIGVEFD
jgi:predicted nucleotide-binding protein/MinD-like ATPase involved in chromosome partitioning or flagellar assembly